MARRPGFRSYGRDPGPLPTHLMCAHHVIRSLAPSHGSRRISPQRCKQHTTLQWYAWVSRAQRPSRRHDWETLNVGRERQGWRRASPRASTTSACGASNCCCARTRPPRRTADRCPSACGGSPPSAPPLSPTGRRYPRWRTRCLSPAVALAIRSKAMLPPRTVPAPRRYRHCEQRSRLAFRARFVPSHAARVTNSVCINECTDGAVAMGENVHQACVAGPQ
jgi:hypothetical protein